MKGDDEMGNEKLDKFLEERESVRWSGTAQPYGLFDATHKMTSCMSLLWAVLWVVIMAGGYYWICVSKGQEIKTGVMLFCVAIPLVIAWSPITDKSNVKKLIYAVTNKRILVASQEASNVCAMRIANVDELRLEKTANGNCHVKFGSPVFKAASRKLPRLAFRGEYDTENGEKVYKGLVFYNISAEDGNVLRNLLQPALEV